jgi:hypothetical protein
MKSIIFYLNENSNMCYLALIKVLNLLGIELKMLGKGESTGSQRYVLIPSHNKIDEKANLYLDNELPAHDAIAARLKYSGIYNYFLYYSMPGEISNDTKEKLKVQFGMKVVEDLISLIEAGTKLPGKLDSAKIEHICKPGLQKKVEKILNHDWKEPVEESVLERAEACISKAEVILTNYSRGKDTRESLEKIIQIFGGKRNE